MLGEIGSMDFYYRLLSRYKLKLILRKVPKNGIAPIFVNIKAKIKIQYYSLKISRAKIYAKYNQIEKRNMKHSF